MILTKILPHDAPMILIDDLVDINLKNKSIIAKVTIKNDMIFFNKKLQGVSSLCGIEFMAQTIGCYAYYKNKKQEPQIGFLLGTRLYNNGIDIFKLGETYIIKAYEFFGDDGIISFECSIYNSQNEECASATLNVYQNANAKGIIENG